MAAFKPHVAHASPLRSSGRDHAALRPIIRQYLSTNLPEATAIDDISITSPSSAGVANETLMVSTFTAGAQGPRYVFRLEGEEHLYPRPDIGSHARIYRQIGQNSTVPVPRIHLIEDDSAILGARFMVMEWVEGRVPPDSPNFQRSGWLKDLRPARQELIWQDCIAQMAKLHAMDPAGFDFLRWRDDGAGEASGIGRTGLGSALEYWNDYALWCGADDIPIFGAARDWLSGKLPRNEAGAFSWGDARLPNTIIRGDSCAAILDWDMVSLAGPEADLAWWAIADHKHTLTQNVPRLPGIGSPAQTIRLWESLSGRSVRNMDWHLVFAAYRQALIAYRLFCLNNGVEASAADFLETPGVGVQWLASLLDQPLPNRLTMAFSSLEK
ncbi:phosphotransferase family protein [Parasphingorhabdus sp.]